MAEIKSDQNSRDHDRSQRKKTRRHGAADQTRSDQRQKLQRIPALRLQKEVRRLLGKNPSRVQTEWQAQRFRPQGRVTENPTRGKKTRGTEKQQSRSGQVRNKTPQLGESAPPADSLGRQLGPGRTDKMHRGEKNRGHGQRRQRTQGPQADAEYDTAEKKFLDGGNRRRRHDNPSQPEPRPFGPQDKKSGRHVKQGQQEHDAGRQNQTGDNIPAGHRVAQQIEFGPAPHAQPTDRRPKQNQRGYLHASGQHPVKRKTRQPVRDAGGGHGLARPENKWRDQSPGRQHGRHEHKYFQQAGHAIYRGHRETAAGRADYRCCIPALAGFFSRDSAAPDAIATIRGGAAPGKGFVPAAFRETNTLFPSAPLDRRRVRPTPP